MKIRREGKVAFNLKVRGGASDSTLSTFQRLKEDVYEGSNSYPIG